MKILLHNCQGVTDGSIELPANSLIEFTGDNSNGKSTVSRFLEHLAKCDLHLSEIREALIKDDKPSAQFAIINDSNAELIVLLYRETGKSYIAYLPNANDPNNGIARQISDRDACAKLIHKFGFRSYANGDICLNLAPTFGGIPLVTTSGKTNFEIVDDFTKDAVADEFLNAYKTYTRPVFARKAKSLKERRAELERLVETNLYPDWEFCKDFVSKNETLARALTNIVFMEQVDYTRPKAYHVVEMSPISYTRPCAFLYSFCEEMRGDLREVIEYNNKRCPNCGRPYLEE